ncbi:MAG: nitrous oxide reductase family maturation protein NosD [Promethearchaeota archaeon]
MRKIKAHARTKIKVSIVIIIIFSIGFMSINLNLYTNKLNFSNTDSLVKDFTGDLKLSGSYTDIMINDLLTTNTTKYGNWTWARTQPWCTQGTGDLGNPYIIEGHTFNSSGSYGSGLQIFNSRKHFIIRNCIFRDAWQSGPFYYFGLFTANTTNGFISNNDFFDNPGGGIYLHSTNMTTVSGNRIKNNGFDGIKTYYNCSYNIISGNSIYNNSRYGIHLETGEFNELSGNILHNITNTNIYLEDSHNNTLTGNSVYNSEGYGIYCYQSNGTIIERNSINNTRHGIVLDESNYAESYGNWIYDNGEIGINCTSNSGNNLFYENAFLRNQKHAFDDGSNNVWNNTNIGNFWKNHTYVSSDGNGDGILDDPYTYIGGLAGSVDYLPIADDGVPEITITSPIDNDVFSETPPDFTLIIPNNNLYSRWYTINNTVTTYPFTGVGGTIDQTAWNALSNGDITLTFYVQLLGNISSDEAIIQKDTLAPVITIYSPASGDVFGTTPPTFNMTITDPNLDTVWYIIEDREPTIIVDFVEFTIPSLIWNFLPEGTANVTFYANDTLGHLSFQSLILSKNITGDIVDFWIGLDFFIAGLFVTLFSGLAISIVIIKIYRKKQILNK